MTTVGIIGFGEFGRFMATHLMPHMQVCVTNRSDRSKDAVALGVPYVTHEEAAAQDVVILSTPVQNMEEMLQRIAPFVKQGALVIDVASVKVKPIEMMKQMLPESVEIVGLHPMFGPQSGKNGIEGLRCVLCDVRTTRLDCIRSFLTKTLKLRVIEMSADEHDKQMACVQGLTHWVSRAIRAMNLPQTELATPSYKNFLAVEEMLRTDSMALFYTIERENPHAGPMRKLFQQKLQELEDQIQTES